MCRPCICIFVVRGTLCTRARVRRLSTRLRWVLLLGRLYAFTRSYAGKTDRTLRMATRVCVCMCQPDQLRLRGNTNNGVICVDWWSTARTQARGTLKGGAFPFPFLTNWQQSSYISYIIINKLSALSHALSLPLAARSLIVSLSLSKYGNHTQDRSITIPSYVLISAKIERGSRNRYHLYENCAGELTRSVHSCATWIIFKVAWYTLHENNRTTVQRQWQLWRLPKMNNFYKNLFFYTKLDTTFISLLHLIRTLKAPGRHFLQLKFPSRTSAVFSIYAFVEHQNNEHNTPSDLLSSFLMDSQHFLTK